MNTDQETLFVSRRDSWSPVLRRLVICAVAVFVAVSLSGAGCLIKQGKRQEKANDVPIITKLPNLCQVLQNHPYTRPIVGTAGPDPEGATFPRQECVWPANKTPIRARVSVEILVTLDKPAKATAREDADHRRDRASCYGSECGSNKRRWTRLPYKELTCGLAANPRAVEQLAIMWRHNVVVIVHLETRSTASPDELAGMLKSPNNRVRRILDVLDKQLVDPYRVYENKQPVQPSKSGADRCRYG